jgi:hypothetical protein
LASAWAARLRSLLFFLIFHLEQKRILFNQTNIVYNVIFNKRNNFCWDIPNHKLLKNIEFANVENSWAAWANSLREPTYDKLDRVLINSDWEQKFPIVSVQILPRIEALSDHAPILLTTANPSPQRTRPFKFDLGWLHRDGYSDMVKKVWEKPDVRLSPI